MKKWLIILVTVLVIFICTIVFFLAQTRKDKVINLKNNFNGKSVSIIIYKGKYYLHDFKVNSLMSIKTPPQMAVWVEDSKGNYIETLYATSKIVYQNWSKAPSDTSKNGQIRRDEALPYWTHKKGSAQIVPEAVTSATSMGSSTINTKLNTANDTYIILAEINQSTDFNQDYPKEAKLGAANYSGGEYGSGQPAIVYAATINASDNKTFELVSIGHSAPNGSDGNLYKDISKLTTSKDIVSKITFTIK